MQNVHLEKWPFGYGWQIKKFYGAMEAPANAAIPGFPLAWTHGTNGPITADAMWAPIHSKEDFAKYKGKLKGKIVLIFDPTILPLHTTADAAKSPTDEEILARANTPFGGRGPGGAGAGPADRDPSDRGRHGEGTWEFTPTSLTLSGNQALRNELNTFLQAEAPAVVLTPGLQRRRRHNLRFLRRLAGPERPDSASYGGYRSRTVQPRRSPAAAQHHAQAHVRRPGGIPEGRPKRLQRSRRDYGHHQKR